MIYCDGMMIDDETFYYLDHVQLTHITFVIYSGNPEY